MATPITATASPAVIPAAASLFTRARSADIDQLSVSCRRTVAATPIGMPASISPGLVAQTHDLLHPLRGGSVSGQY